MPDFLGFGLSDKAVYFDRSPHNSRTEQMIDLLNHLSVGPRAVHVVGTSFGGSVALRLAAATAGTALSLTTVTSISGTGGGRWKTEVMDSQMSYWEGTRDDLGRILHLLVSDSLTLEEFGRQLAMRWQAAQIPGHYRAVASTSTRMPEGLRTAVADDWPKPLQSLPTPIHLVAGRHDLLLNPGWVEAIAGAAPDVTVTWLTSGHSPNIETPDLLADDLIGFMRAHSGPTQ